MLPGNATRLPSLGLAESLRQSRTGQLALTVAASVFVALCAHVSMPLPFTPVPTTLANFAVVLVGLCLGPQMAFAALTLYLAEGAAGLPVFSPTGPGGIAQLLGPTAGYLFAYPFAAAIAGAAVRLLIKRSGISRMPAAILAGAAASLPIYLVGAGWLGYLLHLDVAPALHLAVTPFLPAEALKLTTAGGIFAMLGRNRRA